MKFLLSLVVLFSVNVEAEILAADAARTYFAAFANRDGVTMASMYKDGVKNVFTDPVFPNLNSAEAKGMWKMLLAGNAAFAVDYQIISVDGNTVKANWQARYVFPATGRSVLNRGTSVITIENGLIVKQVDSYNLCNWTGQALPPVVAQIACLHPEVSLRPLARHSLKTFMQNN
jgi:hypothetical protein